jgi:hypothetical protein
MNCFMVYKPSFKVDKPSLRSINLALKVDKPSFKVDKPSFKGRVNLVYWMLKPIDERAFRI